MISFRLALNNRSVNGDIDWKYLPNWAEELPDQADMYRLRANLYQCKELPSADDDGTSDPFIEVWSPDDQSYTTDIIENNNNPIFFKVIEIPYYTISLDYAPPIVLNIFDRDTAIMDSDDFMGRAVIHFDKRRMGGPEDEPPVPTWEDVRMGFDPSEKPMGKVLVSFNLCSPNQEFS